MFWEDLPKTGPLNTVLPLCHSTESVNVRGILSAEIINTTTCPNYGEELVYLFYGRPGYRTSATSPTDILEFYPVVFIVNPIALSAIQRMLPFDSGALVKGLYAEFVHPTLEKERFHVPAPLKNLIHIVDHCFGSNENYFFSRSSADFAPPKTRFELSSYHRMLKSSVVAKSDDRRVTFEVQSAKPVGLSRDTLLAVVGPAVFEDEPYFADKLAEWGIVFEGYDVHISSPREVYGLVFERTKKILGELGWL